MILEKFWWKILKSNQANWKKATLRFWWNRSSLGLCGKQRLYKSLFSLLKCDVWRSGDVTFDIGKNAVCHGHNLTTKSQRMSQYDIFYEKYSPFAIHLPSVMAFVGQRPVDWFRLLALQCLCTFPTLFKSVLKQSCQITCSYLRCGLTNALYSCTRLSPSRCSYDLLMSPTSLFALFTAASTWSDSLNLLSM